MYDISGGNTDTLVEDATNDWKHLLDEKLVTTSSQYLHHRGRPLLSIWVLGKRNRVVDYSHAVATLDWFQYEAEEKYISVGWRDLTRDSRTHLEWTNVRIATLTSFRLGLSEDITTKNSRHVSPQVHYPRHGGMRKRKH
jgi:hypothetical protein